MYYLNDEYLRWFSVGQFDTTWTWANTFYEARLYDALQLIMNMYNTF